MISPSTAALLIALATNVPGAAPLPQRSPEVFVMTLEQRQAVVDLLKKQTEQIAALQRQLQATNEKLGCV